VRLRRLFRIRLAVFHMDHRLPPDSATAVSYVCRLADRHGLPFHLAVAGAEAGRSASLELCGRFGRAREARRIARALGSTRGPEVMRTFARTADHLRRDATALFAHADEHAQTLVELRDHGFAIRARPLLDLPPALSSRVARRGFQRADLGWDHEAIDAVLDLA